MQVERSTSDDSGISAQCSWSGSLGLPLGSLPQTGFDATDTRARGRRMRDAEIEARGFEHLELARADLSLLPGERLRTSLEFPRHARRDLESDDFDVLKRWIGSPDATWSGGPPRRLQHNGLCGPNDPRLDVAEWTMLARETRRSLEAVADAYLFADSGLVRDYKPVLERLYGPVPVALLWMGRLEIAAGAVFEVGGEATVLFADEVVIHAGGKLRFTAHAHFSTASLTRLGSNTGGVAS